MQAVIMGGGNGARLYPYTSIIPKPLLPIDDKPIIEIIIRQLKSNGFTRVSIALGYLSKLIQAFLGDGSKFGLTIDYSIERSPLGTIAPLKLFHDLEPTILVMNADLLTNMNFRAFLEFHRRNKCAATIGVYEKKVQSSLGVIEVDGDCRLKHYTEKPEFRYKVNMGIYAFESRVVSYLDGQKRVDFPDFIAALQKAREEVRCYHFKGYWLDIGQHCDYAQAVREFKKIRGELNIE